MIIIIITVEETMVVGENSIDYYFDVNFLAERDKSSCDFIIHHTIVTHASASCR